jgi:hypothetical protein
MFHRNWRCLPYLIFDPCLILLEIVDGVAGQKICPFNGGACSLNKGVPDTGENESDNECRKPPRQTKVCKRNNGGCHQGKESTMEHRRSGSECTDILTGTGGALAHLCAGLAKLLSNEGGDVARQIGKQFANGAVVSSLSH